MRRKRVLLAIHPHFDPRSTRARQGTEWQVWQTLRQLGFITQILGANNDMGAFDKELARFQPHIVFNLLEEFRHEAVFDFHIITYLEALGIPYTGCNPRGMILSRNKYLVSQAAASCGIQVPRGWVLPTKTRDFPNLNLPYPSFVKLNREHASLGIHESNRVTNHDELRQVCARLRDDYFCEILVQEFIPGSDISVSLWGNRRVEVFPPRQLRLGGPHRVLTEHLKFNPSNQRRRGLKSQWYQQPIVPRMQSEAKRIFELLDLSGYARLDFRVSPSHKEPYLIDVNANPNLARREDFAASAGGAGWSYPDLINQIVNLGKNYRPKV